MPVRDQEATADTAAVLESAVTGISQAEPCRSLGECPERYPLYVWKLQMWSQYVSPTYEDEPWPPYTPIKKEPSLPNKFHKIINKQIATPNPDYTSNNIQKEQLVGVKNTASSISARTWTHTKQFISKNLEWATSTIQTVIQTAVQGSHPKSLTQQREYLFYLHDQVAPVYTWEQHLLPEAPHNQLHSFKWWTGWVRT